MSSFRRPLVVTATPMSDDIDLQISELVDVPYSLHAFERMSLIPDGVTYSGLFAELRAPAVILERWAPQDRFVLVGSDVCDAFQLPLEPLDMTKRGGRTFMHLPVPPDDRDAACRALTLFLGGPQAEPRCGFG